VSTWARVCVCVTPDVLFVGGGVRAEPRQRGPEASNQNSGGGRPVGHVHTRPVSLHREEGTSTHKHTHTQPCGTFIYIFLYIYFFIHTNIVLNISLYVYIYFLIYIYWIYILFVYL